MNADHLTYLFPAVGAGLGLFLVGIVNLLLIRRSLTVRAAATLAAGGVAVGGVWALDQPGATSAAAVYFALGLIPCALLASRRLVGGLATAVAVTHYPAVRFGLLTLAGMGVVLGSVVVYERADEQALLASMEEFEFAQGRVPTAPCEGLKATTDKGSPIVPTEPTGPVPGDKLGQAEQKILANAQLNDRILRRGPADHRSNCHGWVFAAGKYLLSGNDVELILRENGYQETPQPQSGDVAVYRQGGTVAHTAVVRYVTEGQPVLVEGKWGNLGIFLHPVDTSVYGTDYAFYRSPRNGHLLVGLGGQPASDTRLPVIAE